MSAAYHLKSNGEVEECQAKMFCSLGQHYSTPGEAKGGHLKIDSPKRTDLSSMRTAAPKKSSDLSYLNTPGEITASPRDLYTVTTEKKEVTRSLLKRSEEIKANGGMFTAEDFAKYSEKHLRIIKIFMDKSELVEEMMKNKKGIINEYQKTNKRKFR